MYLIIIVVIIMIIMIIVITIGSWAPTRAAWRTWRSRKGVLSC